MPTWAVFLLCAGSAVLGLLLGAASVVMWARLEHWLDYSSVIDSLREDNKGGAG